MNRDEFAAGTDPRDPASRLLVRELRLDAGVVAISFPTARGKTYALEFSNSLAPANWQPLGSVIGDGAEQTVLDPGAPAGQRFYRLRVSP